MTPNLEPHQKISQKFAQTSCIFRFYPSCHVAEQTPWPGRSRLGGGDRWRDRDRLRFLFLFPSSIFLGIWGSWFHPGEAMTPQISWLVPGTHRITVGKKRCLQLKKMLTSSSDNILQLTSSPFFQQKWRDWKVFRGKTNSSKSLNFFSNCCSGGVRNRLNSTLIDSCFNRDCPTSFKMEMEIHTFSYCTSTRSHLVSYSFYQNRHTGFASGNQIFQKWLHFLLRFLSENGLSDFSLVVISPMFFHHTPNRKSFFESSEIDTILSAQKKGDQISKGDPLQIIFEGQMGLEDDEQNMGICPKGCYPLNPSSPKNRPTAELGGGRQLFKNSWPQQAQNEMFFFELICPTSQSLKMCQKVKIDVPPKMVPLSEQKNRKTQLSCLEFFSPMLETSLHLFMCRQAVLHLQFRTPFLASYFFVGHKTPYFLNDRWPKLLWLGSPAWFERSPPHWHCAHSQWPRKFLFCWMMFFWSVDNFGFRWAFKKNILDLALVDASLVINLVDFLF